MIVRPERDDDRPRILAVVEAAFGQPGERVLASSQVRELGVALDLIRDHFAPAYAAAGGAWWAMDVEFKFDADGDEVPPLYIKQARPFGNR